MALVLTTGPALEPVSLSEVKLHLRVDHGDEDQLIASLITAARIHLETMLGLVFITQHWSLFLDEWPQSSSVVLPLSPVQSITRLTLYDESDGAGVINPSNYFLDALSQPARLIWRGSTTRPWPERHFNGIEIALTAGFGAAASDVPQPLRQAVRLLVAHWYERRDPVGLGDEGGDIPQMVMMLTNAYRRVQL